MIKISLDNLEDQKSILVSYFNENGCEPNEISREQSWKLCYDVFGRFINKDELKEHYCQYKYNSINDSDSDNNDVERVISESLLSKILLGTLVCAPAYDEFLKEGLKKANISQLSFSEKSLKRIVEENLKNIPAVA